MKSLISRGGFRFFNHMSAISRKRHRWSLVLSGLYQCIGQLSDRYINVHGVQICSSFVYHAGLRVFHVK